MSNKKRPLWSVKETGNKVTFTLKKPRQGDTIHLDSLKVFLTSHNAKSDYDSYPTAMQAYSTIHFSGFNLEDALEYLGTVNIRHLFDERNVKPKRDIQPPSLHALKRSLLAVAFGEMLCAKERFVVDDSFLNITDTDPPPRCYGCKYNKGAQKDHWGEGGCITSNWRSPSPSG